MDRGVRADGLRPAFPTKTFPNHFTIVTGMYTERHGLVGNTMYDPARGLTYSMSDRSAVRDGRWYLGEPIWVTAERQGMVTAPNFWPGSEAMIKGVMPSYWRPYDGKVPLDVRVDSVIWWLSFPVERRPHFVTLYMSDVDSAGHDLGPDDPEIEKAIIRVDNAIGRLLDGIASLAIQDQIYLLIVTDHGMATTGPDQYTAIETLIDDPKVRIVDSGPYANLSVSGTLRDATSVRDTINAKLQHGRAYLRSEVPAELHYRHSPRIGDVVIIMEEHFQVGPREWTPKKPGGTHGWRPELDSMQGIFLAMGPGIKNGSRIPTVSNIDIYPFMTEVLRLKPNAPIDGKAGVLRRQLLK